MELGHQRQSDIGGIVADGGDDLLLVDRQRQRMPHALIGPGRPRHVVLQPFGRREGKRIELALERRIPLNPGDVLRGQAGHEVDLIRLEGPELRGTDIAGGDRHLDMLDRRFLAAVIGIGVHGDGLIVDPGGQLVGPVGDDILRRDPFVAELLDDRLRHRRQIGQRQLGAELRRQARRHDLERIVAGRLDADFAEIRDLAFVVVIGILDVAQEDGDLASRLRLEDALPGIYPIGGGDGLAIRPFVVRVEGDGPSAAVRRELDALGLLHREAAVLVQPRQRLEQLRVDEDRKVRGEVRIHVARLADDHAERLRVVRRGDPRRRGNGRQQSQRRDEQCGTHPCIHFLPLSVQGLPDGHPVPAALSVIGQGCCPEPSISRTADGFPISSLVYDTRRASEASS